VAGADDRDCDDGVHGLQRHSISEASQCSTGLSNQALPSIRKPGSGVTWMRNGTLGSSVGWGSPPGRARHAFPMARSSRSRAFCTSWSISAVASLSRSQVTAPLPSSVRFQRAVEWPQDEPRGASPFWMPPPPSLLLFEQACETTLPYGQMPLSAALVPSGPLPPCRRPSQSVNAVLPSEPCRQNVSAGVNGSLNRSWVLFRGLGSSKLFSLWTYFATFVPAPAPPPLLRRVHVHSAWWF